MIVIIKRSLQLPNFSSLQRQIYLYLFFFPLNCWVFLLPDQDLHQFQPNIHGGKSMGPHTYTRAHTHTHPLMLPNSIHWSFPRHIPPNSFFYLSPSPLLDLYIQSHSNDWKNHWWEEPKRLFTNLP